jgi:hypothetical protein
MTSEKSSSLVQFKHRCETTLYHQLSDEDKLKLQWLWALGAPLEHRFISGPKWHRTESMHRGWKNVNLDAYIRPV